MDKLVIPKQKRSPGSGRLAVWIDSGEFYIRESTDRNDVQTVCVTRAELLKILTLIEEKKNV